MAHSAALAHEAHPAPHRRRTTLLALIFVTVGPPLAWSVHLIVNYAFASQSCYPDGRPLIAPSFRGLWPLLIAVDVMSLVISACAAVLAYRLWQVTAREMPEPEPAMMEAGEGRTRFLAIWGMLIAIGFFVAVIFDFVGLWILPICG
jgi:hypothetical protein